MRPRHALIAARRHAAFVGAAGLAFLMAQVLGAGKPANPAVRASGEAGGRPEAGGASAAT